MTQDTLSGRYRRAEPVRSSNFEGPTAYQLAWPKLILFVEEMSASPSVEAQVRQLLSDHSGMRNIERLGRSDDLYLAGLTSHATVRTMIALEDAFGIEFPDQMLGRATFRSIGSIEGAVEQLRRS